MDKNTNIEKLIAHFGGQVKAAQALGVRQPTVSAWLNGTHGVGPIVAMKAERLTGISAASLCPRLGELDAA